MKRDDRMMEEMVGMQVKEGKEVEGKGYKYVPSGQLPLVYFRVQCLSVTVSIATQANNILDHCKTPSST